MIETKVQLARELHFWCSKKCRNTEKPCPSCLHLPTPLHPNPAQSEATVWDILMDNNFITKNTP